MEPMEQQEIEKFLENLRRVHCRMNYYKFLEATDFIDCNYSNQKYIELRTGITCLCQFDAETLAKLLK